jgi:hypothetical protein
VISRLHVPSYPGIWVTGQRGEAAGDLPFCCLAASVSLIHSGDEGRAGTGRSAKKRLPPVQ